MPDGRKVARVKIQGSRCRGIRFFYPCALFSQGVSYGQLGNYTRAVSDISRAIEMEPQNGLYYYGRGRTYLLAGEKDRAMQDFRKAADLGDEDAQAYLAGAR